MSSLVKITISGEVKTNPEKRYTEDNLAISSFNLDFGLEGQEKLVKVLAFAKMADRIADSVKKGQNVIVEGKLQTITKTEGGVDKKITEINAQGIEIVEKSNGSYQSGAGESNDTSEVSSDDLIGEDEIPF